MKKMLVSALAVAAMALPFAAQAETVTADIVVDENYSFPAAISAGGDSNFIFTALESLLIPGFAVSGTGNNRQLDLMAIRFGLIEVGDADGMPDEVFAFDPIFGQAGNTASGNGSLGAVSLAAGDAIEILFDGSGTAENTSVTVSFNTVSPVPVPAAGGMLLGALVAGGFVARRKKKAS